MAQRESLQGLGPDLIGDLQRKQREFVAERDWESFHTPRNLAALIASEAGELLALFRWDQNALTDRPDDVAHELADVFLGTLRFADVAGIDLGRVGNEKIALNKLNYPIREGILPDRP